MNPQLIVAIITASGILLSSAPVQFQTSEIYADDAETDTDQGLSQKNVGSGDSINFNCGENSIGDSASILCESSPTGTGEPPVGGGAPLTLTVRNCSGTLSFPTAVTCEVVAPFEFIGRLTCFQPVVAIQCSLDRFGGRINLSCLPIPSPSIPSQELQNTFCQRLD